MQINDKACPPPKAFSSELQDKVLKLLRTFSSLKNTLVHLSGGGGCINIGPKFALDRGSRENAAVRWQREEENPSSRD